jgi:hypothetical protein
MKVDEEYGSIVGIEAEQIIVVSGVHEAGFTPVLRVDV